MNTNIPCLLLRTYSLLDYIPVVSTVTNIVDLFLKHVVLTRIPKEDIGKNRYYTYLHKKRYSRCITLLLPFFGNIIVGVYDFAI